MSLIYLGASGIVATVRDAYMDTPNNRLITVHSDNSLRGYSLSTLLQTFAATGLTTAPAGVTLINASSAVVPNFNTTTVDYVELSSGYKQAVAGGFANSFARPQLVATDLASGIALAVGNGRSVAIIKASPQTVTTVTPSIADTNATFECIVLRTSGAWLVGSQYGYIYELNASGAITDQLKISVQPSTGTSLGVSLAALPIIGNLSYAENLLTVGTEEGVFVYDWSTKTQIKYSPATTGTTVAGCTLSNTASGVCIQSYTTPNIGSTFKELDIAYRPLFIRDELWGPSNTSTLVTGINPTTNIGWAIQPALSLLHVFKVIPRASTLRTFSAQIAGVDQRCRLSLIDDTGGAGNNFVCFDTIMQSPATYRVPTGKSIIEVKKVGEGATALWSGSSYST